MKAFILWLKDLFKFSNIVVLLVIFMNIWFTDRALEAFEKVGTEPMILIGAFFAFTGTELLALSSIKKTKMKVDAINENKYREDESNRNIG